MITNPAIAQILQTLSHDLSETIAPALDDEALSVKVQMMGAVLDSLAVRCENEREWIAQETQAIEAVAREALSALRDDDKLRRAFAQISDDDDIATRYLKASEVLSCLAEAAFQSDSAELQTKVETLLTQRLANEQQAIGENFQVIGRD
jgi:hypothetical protein